MSIYNIAVETIKGEQETLAAYKGKVMVIVNTATKCGFAPQFTGLQKLYETYRDQGLVVLGFPCDQFANQELEHNDEIAQVCQLNFGVSFPLYGKINVNGKNAHPLFQYLTAEAPGFLGSKAIKWNFTKFVIDQAGNVVKRYAPKDDPAEMEEIIVKLLSNGAAVHN